MNLKAFFSRGKNTAPIIVISGLPRSGTSMIMKMMKAGGVEIASDGQREADIDNPKGYFELERVKDLDKDKDRSWMGQLKGKAVKIISYFIEYLPGAYRYKVIFIERNLEEVIASQNKMLVNRGKKVDPSEDEKMIKYFEKHLKKVKDILNNRPCFDALYLNHRDCLKDPTNQVVKINTFLGGCLDEEKMAEVVDPDLYRNRKA